MSGGSREVKATPVNNQPSSTPARATLMVQQLQLLLLLLLQQLLHHEGVAKLIAAPNPSSKRLEAVNRKNQSAERSLRIGSCRSCKLAILCNGWQEQRHP
jgi:hypothetical protein